MNLVNPDSHFFLFCKFEVEVMLASVFLRQSMAIGLLQLSVMLFRIPHILKYIKMTSSPFDENCYVERSGNV